MRYVFLLFFVSLWTSFLSCTPNEKANTFIANSRDSIPLTTSTLQQTVSITPEGTTIKDRFSPPTQATRVAAANGSFGKYLRDLPLKPAGSPVLYYNGQEKFNQVQEAVIDLDVGKRDLQQCADAIMRLRGEYLFQQASFDRIQFHFTNGFNATYSKWRAGYRIKVEGNKVSWVNHQNRNSSSYDSFRKYLNMVFSYAGTLSLQKEVNPVRLSDMQIGDIFIQGGSPGHAIIIVDMAKDNHTNEIYFMLAQSYMPAQDIHVLKNPNNPIISPWYQAKNLEILETPEWTFNKKDLSRLPN